MTYTHGVWNQNAKRNLVTGKMVQYRLISVLIRGTKTMWNRPKCGTGTHEMGKRKTITKMYSFWIRGWHDLVQCAGDTTK